MNLESVVFTLTANIQPYLNQMGMAQARLVGLAAMGTSAVASHGIRLAAEFEKTAVAFEVMAGSAEVGKKLIQDVQNMAVETPFKSQELAQGAKQLKSFGIENEQVMATLQSLAEVSAGTGTELGRIILAFGQINVAGKLMGTELRQMVDAGVPLIEQLAKVMGKPKESIRALIEQGHVGFPQVVAAFNNMTTAGGMYAGLMDRVNKTTLAGRWQNFEENLELVVRDFVMSAAAGVGLNSILTSMADRMERMRKGTEGSAVFAFFRNLRDGVVGVYNVISHAVGWVAQLVGGFQEFYDRNQDVLIVVGAVVGLGVALNVAALAANALVGVGLYLWYGRLARMISTVVVELLSMSRLLAVVDAVLFTMLPMAVRGFGALLWLGVTPLIIALRAAYLVSVQWMLVLAVRMTTNVRMAAALRMAWQSIMVMVSGWWALTKSITGLGIAMANLRALSVAAATAFLAVRAAGGGLAAMRVAADGLTGFTRLFAVLGGGAATLLGVLGNIAPLLVLIGAGVLMSRAGLFQGFAQEAYNTFRDIGGYWMTLWDGLKSAVAAGDMNTAFDIIAAGIELSWKRLMISMENAWEVFKFKLTLKENLAGMFADVLNAAASVTGAVLKMVPGVNNGDVDQNVAAFHREREREQAMLEQMKANNPKLAEFLSQRQASMAKQIAQLQPDVMRLGALNARGLESGAGKKMEDWLNDNASEIYRVQLAYRKWNDSLTGGRFPLLGVEQVFDRHGQAVDSFASSSGLLVNTFKTLDEAIAQHNREAVAASSFKGGFGGYARSVGEIYAEMQKGPGGVRGYGVLGYDQARELRASGVSPDVFNRLPKDLQDFAVKMGKELNLGGPGLPSTFDYFGNSAFSKGMLVPAAISGRARDEANKLIKDIANGVGKLDDFRIQAGLLNEAYLGPYGANTARNFVGPVPMNPDDPRLKYGASLTKEQLVTGLGLGWEKAMKGYEPPESKLPPAALYGSAEAASIVQANANKQVDTQEAIRSILEEMKYLEQKAAEQRTKNGEALLKLLDQGVLVPFEPAK